MIIQSIKNSLCLAIAAMAILAAVPSTIFAQGETFTDCDAWSAAVCGSILDDDFESFVDFNGEFLTEGFFGGVPTPQSLVWGEVSQDGNAPAALAVIVAPIEAVGIARSVVFDNAGDDGRPVVFTPNTTALGPLEGVCFDYVSAVPGNGVISFNAYDGDTLVASIPLPNELDDDGNPVKSTFGWQNTEQLNVTRFEFAIDGSDTTSTPTGIVGNGQLSFGEGCDPPEVSCFDQLAAVESGVADFVDTLSGSDAYFAQGSLDCINWMQNDCFWAQPSENRLSRYGGSMFIGAAYAVCYLEWVEDPAADVLIDELVAVLECIVDHEIAYAIENGGNTCYIDRAEDYAELGSIIDEDFDNQVVATLAYRLAWLHAYYATK